MLVCDDLGLFRRRMIVALEADAFIEVIAECDDPDDAITVARELVPDVVFIGTQLSETGVVRVTAGLCEVVPTLRVVVVVGPDDVRDAIRASRSGAMGFVGREDAIDRAAQIAHAVMAGRPVIPVEVAEGLLREFESLGRPRDSEQPGLEPPTLSDRERKVFVGLREGLGFDAISKRLGISSTTAANLAGSALERLHRHTRTEAVMYTVADKIYGFR